MQSQARAQGQACAALQQVRSTYTLPGLSVAVGRPDGSVVEITLGNSAGDAAPIMPGAKFLSGSIGKTYVAALAMDLYERGQIELDAPVKKLLGSEAWFRDLPNSGSFTLRQLLTHTSGLPSHVEEPAFQRAITDRIHRCPECVFSPTEAIAFIDGHKPLFAAGQGWSYSETGYLVAGLAIEKATGRKYYELLKEKILDPLGLTQTEPSNQSRIAGLVSGRIDPKSNYFNLSPPVTMQDGRLQFNPAFEWTGGGLAVSSADLVRWARLLYTGHAFSEPYMQDLFASAATGNPDARYGLGVGIRGRGMSVSYGHTGSIPGYRSGLRYFPGSQLAVAAQTNTDTDDENVFPAAVDAAIKADGILTTASGGQRTSMAVRCP
jgi:D-alanyl-D-alanine carboxypeptidase